MKDKGTPLLLLTWTLLWLGIVWTTAHAQEGSPDDTLATLGSPAGLDPTLKSALTPEFLESKIKEAEAATDLDEAEKSTLTEQYRTALSELKAASALEMKAAAYKRALETAPAKVKTIRDELASRSQEAPAQALELPTDASVADSEQQLTKTQADISAMDAKLAEIEKEIEASATRPAKARLAIDRAKQGLDALEIQMGLPSPEGEPQVLTDARRWTLEARRQSLRSEILMLDQELLSQSVRVELLKAARDKAVDDLGRLKEAGRRLAEQLNTLRQAQAEQVRSETEETRRKAAGGHPLVQELAHSNSILGEELTALIDDLGRITRVQEQVEDRRRRIGEDFRLARQTLEAAGLTQALGQALVDQRRRLPDLRGYRRAASQREAAIAEATLHQIRFSEERRKLREPDAYVQELLRGQAAGKPSAQVIAQLHELAERRATLLEKVLDAAESHLRALGELDYASSQLMKVVEDYDDFLAERLLWVRSSAPVNWETINALPRALLWATAPAGWLEVAEVLLYELARSPLLWVSLSLAGLLQWKGHAMRRRIRATAEHLRRIRTDSFRYTFEALGLTFLLAAPLPLLLVSLGWPLYASLEATDFTRSIGRGAISVSLGIYYLLAFRFLCITGGVADRHFRWSTEVLEKLRRSFDWFLAVLMPLGFIAAAAFTYKDVTYSGSLGRLSLIALMTGLALFLGRLLHPQRGVVRSFLVDHPEGWLHRMRKLWYPLVMATPLALAVLTAIGYQYAAGILLRSLVGTMYLALAIIVVHQLILRWLVVVRRRLALQAALERRAARAAQQEGQIEQSTTGAVEIQAAEEIDLDSLDEQTRRLMNTLLFIGGALVLWLIWSPVLPAFGIFDDVALWHHRGIVNGEERIIPVSLADIGLALLIALIATVAAKNVPALLEILLLSRTRLSSGSRYAIKTLTGYSVVTVGALMAFGTLGLSWGQVQWLVAALGVGIGFGLQEIVANFISGIIILFERPIRVGDVVSIDETTGAVSKIRFRATTIRNWDKQELLVPNKEFITGRLLNWTLSDNLNRVVITVGADYGSDVPRALALLEEAAREHEQVLEDPAPLISFEGFGDNALNLVLRCYLGTLDNRLVIISELHQSINEKFRAEGISIAFPQRDVHLSAVEPLNVRLQRTWPEAAEPSPPELRSAPERPASRPGQ
jgi:potassium efflux system protein